MAQRFDFPYASTTEPWVEIVEQPKSTAMRFRYQCEGRSAGTILGVNATNTSKTYPTIKIHNCGPAAVVVVSCVTQNPPYYPHPHSLIGANCANSVCTLRIKGSDTVVMTNVGIQCCKRNEVMKAIDDRKTIRVDPFGTGYVTDLDKLDLSAVRLCFQVFLPDSTKKFTRVIEPIVSEPIIDKKLITSLTICRLSKRASTADGNDEVVLLCDKIKKDDIEVRFFEEDQDGEVIWEAFGQFTPNDVHHQCAVTFKTPPFRDRDIESPVTVQIQLRRPSDSAVGASKEFQYIPNDNQGLANMRRKKTTPRITQQQQQLVSDSIATAAAVAQLANYYDDYQKHAQVTTVTNNSSSNLVPLSVIQNEDNVDQSTSSSLSLPHQLPPPVLSSAMGASYVSSHRSTFGLATVPHHDVPIDFSARKPWSSPSSSTVSMLQAVDDIKPENGAISTVGDDAVIQQQLQQQQQFLENGAILLNQTEDGRLVLPPGFRIILPDGTELSGALDNNLVMGVSQADQLQQNDVNGGDGLLKSETQMMEIYRNNGEHLTKAMVQNGSVSVYDQRDI